MSPGRLSVTVTVEDQGSRLDHFLTRHVAGRTRSALERLIRDGRVTVDGAVAPKPGLGLRSGMRVEVEIPEAPPAGPRPEPIPVEVVFEDRHLAVVDKQAGLVVHPGHGRRTGTLVAALLGRGMELAPAGGSERPGIVHRLDRDTSGLMVVAKTDPAHHGLTRAFARREVRKGYLALVWGHPEPPAGTVDAAIGRSRADRTRMSVRVPRARSAVTRYRTMARMPGFALLAVEIATGRTHQIRVHMQSLRHPVVGDDRYGGRAWAGVRDPVRRRVLRDFDRLALHASNLAFRHPVTGESLSFHSPLPRDLRALVEALGGTA